MDDRVLVDTSAWVAFLRDDDSATADLVDGLLREDRAAICGLVRAELLQGARSERDFDRLSGLLDATANLAGPPDLWKSVAELALRLRRSGQNGIGIPDLVVAVTAHHHDTGLLTLDAHFERIAVLLPLHLVTRTPASPEGQD